MCFTSQISFSLRNRVLLILPAAGFISSLVMVKTAYSFEIVIEFWDSIKCLLSSHLYICFVINLMVVLIAASSTFHNHKIENQDHHQITTCFDDQDSQFFQVSPSPRTPRTGATRITPPPSSATNTCTTSHISSIFHRSSNLDDSSPRISPNTTENHFIANIFDLFSTPPPPRAIPFYEAHDIKNTRIRRADTSEDSSEPTRENVITETAIVLPSDYKEDDEEDTMEATWRLITGEGKPNPTKKQLKKCETWDIPPQNNKISVQGLDNSDPKWKELRKSETFNDAVSTTCRGGLRRDPSMSLEEFNKQVEEFIKKFNDNMKLQRQESEQRVLDMIK